MNSICKWNSPFYKSLRLYSTDVQSFSSTLEGESICLVKQTLLNNSYELIKQKQVWLKTGLFEYLIPSSLTCFSSLILFAAIKHVKLPLNPSKMLTAPFRESFTRDKEKWLILLREDARLFATKP